MNLHDRFLYFYLPKYHRLFYSDKPVVLVNSFQKAGTHMLTEALAASLPLKYNARGVYNHALTRQWPEELKHKNTTPQSVITFLQSKAWPGELLRGHIEYDETLAGYLKKFSIPHILIVRHPLDVLLSLANWWERHAEIPVRPFLVFKEIKSPEARLSFLLTGWHNGEKVWPNLVQRYMNYVGWLKDEATLVLRYEDLVSNPGVAARKLAHFLPVTMVEPKFLETLQQKNNRTYTKANEKVHSALSESLIESYRDLGGIELENAFGYREKTA